MQINNLEIENFKGAPNTILPLRKYNVLCGPNGAGKSSTLEALRCIITGKEPENLIAAGQSTCTIRADIENIGLVERSFGEDSEIRMNGRKTNQKSVAESIQVMLGVTHPVTDVLTSSMVLGSMSSKDLGEFLLSEELLRMDADIDVVMDHCSLSAEAQEELRAQLPKAPDTVTTADLDKAATYFANARRIMKKEVGDLLTRARYTGVIPARTTEDISQERGRIMECIGGLDAAGEAYKESLAVYGKHLDELESAKKKADSITAEPPDPLELDAGRTRLEASGNAISSKERSLSILKLEHTRLKQIFHDLEGPICPISGSLVCSVDKTIASEELHQSLLSIDLECDRLTEELEILSTIHDEQKTQLEDLESRRLLALEKEALLRQAHALSITLPVRPEEPEDDERKQLEAELALLDEEYPLALRYEDAMRATVEQEAKAKKAAVADELVKALSPAKGIRQLFLEHQREPLQNYCNKRAGVLLPGYTILLDTANGLGISLVNSAGNAISYEAASKSEKLRILLILMDMINALSGFRILVLDDLESLDRERLSLLTDLLQLDEVRDAYDHIFLSGVDHKEFVEAMKFLPDAECTWIESFRIGGLAAA